MIQQALMLSRAALGKVNSISAGTTTTVDARVSPLSQSLGVTYDSNNNVTGNQTNDDITDLQNKINSLENNVSDLQNRITNLENRLANYENHTHSYTDDTITDTDDGTGETVTTTKTTGVVQ